MPKEAVQTKSAPVALGPYSQGVRVGQTVYLSGQLGLDPATGNLADGIEAQTHRVFGNLRAVAQAAGGQLDDIVKLTVLLADLADFAKPPYPARATYQVAGLPKAAKLEVEGILVLGG